MKNIKWQIHAEASVSQIMLWILFWKIFGGWVSYLALIFIIGNTYTLIKSVLRLPKNYLK